MWCHVFIETLILIFGSIPLTSGKSARFELSDGHVMRCDPMSDTVHVDMEVDGVTQKLTLDKSTRVDINAPLMSGRSGAITQASVPMLQGEAMFIDQQHKASMKVSCLTARTGTVQISLSGSVEFNKKIWEIKPGESGQIGSYTMEEATRPNFGTDVKARPPTTDVSSVPDRAVPDTPVRQRRSVTAYNVDVLAVIDYSIYSEYFSESTLTTDAEKREEALTNLKRYFAHIMNGIVLRYNDVLMQPPIIVRLSGYYVAEDANSATWTEPFKQYNQATQGFTVDADNALDALETWRTSNTGSLPANDHAMLFTRYDLATVNTDGTLSTGVVGYATLAATCSEQSVSLIEESYDRFEGTAATAAHELGHNLGAQHDGGTDNICYDDERYLMWPSVTSINTYHVWYFSECSIDYFTLFLATLVQTSSGYDCMMAVITTPDDVPDVSSVRQGQELTFEQQCSVGFGAGSEICMSLTSLSTMCGIVYCTLPDFPGYCQGIYPALGTHCGANSWCQGGQCVQTTDPSVPADPCPFAETNANLYQTGMDCATYISTYGIKQCYDSYIISECCTTCSQHNNGNAGCEWGDKITVCKSNHCDQGKIMEDGTAYETVCCNTCPTTLTTTTAGGDLWLPDSSANGISFHTHLAAVLVMVLLVCG